MTVFINDGLHAEKFCPYSIGIDGGFFWQSELLHHSVVISTVKLFQNMLNILVKYILMNSISTSDPDDFQNFISYWL